MLLAAYLFYAAPGQRLAAHQVLSLAQPEHTLCISAMQEVNAADLHFFEKACGSLTHPVNRCRAPLPEERLFVPRIRLLLCRHSLPCTVPEHSTGRRAGCANACDSAEGPHCRRDFCDWSLVGNPPGELTCSDGKHLTYLDGESLSISTRGTGKPHVLVSRAKISSLTMGKESERDRDHRERYKMANYIWAPDSSHLMFDSAGRLWIYDLHTGTGVEIGFTGLGSATIQNFRQTARRFRLCAKTVSA